MVKVVTDSSSDIPFKLARDFDLYVVPGYILFGKHRVRDMYGIDYSQFYEELRRNPIHPQTLPASPYDFYKVFRQLESLGEDILVITLPENLSKYYECARIAARNINKVRVRVVNSTGVSGYQGLIAIQAARMATLGYSLEEIIQMISTIIPKTALYSYVPTLEFLVRGGRVPVTTGKIGTLLKISPILGVVDEKVEPVARTRGVDSGFDKILELFKTHFSSDEPLIGMFLHAVNLTGVATLETVLRANFNIREGFSAKVGSTIGANVGPGTIAAALSPIHKDIVSRW